MKLSSVRIDNISFRFDAEYFRKTHLSFNATIYSKKLKYLVINIQNGDDFREYTTTGTNYLLTGDFSKYGIKDISVTKKVDSRLMPKIVLQNRDLLITRKGNYGKSAVVNDEIAKCFISSEVFYLTVKDINVYYLKIFLDTRYGVNQFEKHIHGIANFSVTQEAVLNFLIPIFPLQFQQSIETLVKLSHEKLSYSQQLYKEAELILNTELGLIDFNPENDNISIVKLSDSLQKTGRLDAEYYQPKWEAIEGRLKKNGFVLIEDICSDINYGTVPTSPYSENGGIPYIKGMNLKQLFITGELDCIVNTEGLSKKFYTQVGDIVISQMGTVGDVGIISAKHENCLFASFTIRIRITEQEKYNPYFVGLFIQNIAKQNYLYKNIAQASVRQNTDLPTIRNMYIPLLPIAIQTTISDKIKHSFQLRQESTALLEQAKHAVEMMIEGGVVIQ